MPEWSEISYFIVNLLSATCRLGVPLLIASLGEIFAQRSGMINIGIEGYVTIGALAAYTGALATGNPWLGVFFAIMAGWLLSMVHAYLSIKLGADQIIAGIGIWISGVGLANFINRQFISEAPGTNMLSMTTTSFSPVQIPGLGHIPVLGPILLKQIILFYVSIGIFIAAIIVFKRTTFGLKIKMAGENPLAVDDAGISVSRIRTSCVGICGALAGMAGAALSVGIMDRFVEDMSAGRGFIALAIVIVAGWEPARAVWGVLMFAGVSALQIRFQLEGIPIPFPFMMMLPYLFAIVIVVGVIKKARIPAAFLVHYKKQ